MHYLLLLFASCGASVLGLGRFRPIAESRAKWYEDQIANMAYKYEKKVRNQMFKNHRYHHLKCGELVKLHTEGSSSKKYGQLVYEALQPSFKETWFSLPNSVRAAYCLALRHSIEIGQHDIDVDHGEKVSQMNAIRLMYVGIMTKIDLGIADDNEEIVVAMLETASNFESRIQSEKIVERLLDEYPLSADVDEVPPIWPLERSEEYLSELMTDVITDGFGEEKIVLFLNKVHRNMDMSKAALVVIAKSILVEIKETTQQMRQDLYTLETQALAATR